MHALRIAAVAVLVGMGASAALARQGQDRPPSGSSLKKLVKRYLEAEEKERREIREEMDRTLAPLPGGRALERLRDSMLDATRRVGPRIRSSGTNYFYDEREKRGKYIARGRKGGTLFVGLHGGGAGSGDAGSIAAGMGGGGWLWIFPEVLEKTEHGWTDSGTDRFVLELIDAAKRMLRVDPNRVYITGHSMGGYGSWTLGAQHADVFAGVAPYAGAPTPIFSNDGTQTVIDIIEGVIPNYYNLPIVFFQSTDDPRVPPAPNQKAHELLKSWKERHPEGFEFRYIEVDDRGHAAPKEGYLPTQRWLAEHERNPRPKKFLWQPVLDWKRHFYWLYWDRPSYGAILQAEVTALNEIDLRVLDGPKAVSGLSVLLGEPLVDLEQEVVIRVDGKEAFRGVVPRTLSTLLLTLPRHDPHLLFDARVDLGDI